MSIATGVAQASKGERERAVETLVAAWRSTPYPRLGDLIDRLDATLPRTPIEPLAWPRKVKTAALGALLPTLASGKLDDIRKRVLALGKRGRDPRIAHALLEIVRAAPWTSDTSRSVWNPIFALLATLDDPRVGASAEAVRSGWGMRAPHRAWLADRLAASLEKQSAAPRETAADRDALDALEAMLVVAPAARSRHDTDAMLAAIHADPFDDNLRSIYADALLERGDPRGELIQLQLQPSPSKDAQRRIATLLKTHARAWLGGIEPVIVKDGVVFARGFVSACKVRFKNESDVRAHGSDPAWATVERLEHSSPHWGANAQYRFYGWLDPAMKSLAEVAVRKASVGELLDAPPWNIRRLTFGSDDEADFVRLGRTTVLPKLEALSISEPPRGWLATTRYANQLRELSLEVQFSDAKVWIDEATALPKLEMLALGDLVLRRDAKRRFTIGSIALRWRQGNQLAEVNGLPAGVLTELTITRGPELPMDRVDAAFRADLTRTARKQAKLKVLDLTALGGKRTTY